MARTFAACGDWGATRTQVLNDNLLQMRTANASQRLYREVVSRLRCLPTSILDLLAGASEADQRYLLWIAICERYPFIGQFAREVVREKLLRLDYRLTHEDYDAFYSAQSVWHPELDLIADSTRAKQRQVVAKMLTEAELLVRDTIIPALPSRALVDAIVAESPALLTYLPVTDRELDQWIQS